MPDIVIPVGSTTAPRYRYYTADLVTNTIIGELSLEDVGYERSLKSPGSFDGKITITDQTNSLDLYNATMPGKTAIYAVRDGVCAWGGIIWGRTYDMVGRSLTISASEFTSYLNHRIVWKAYSQSFEAKLSAESGGNFLVEVVNKTLLNSPLVGDKVRVSFLPNKLRKYTKDYSVVGLASSPAAPFNPGQNAFYVKIPKLPKPPSGSYTGVTVTLKLDTYEYLRDLITNTLSDFEYLQFPNEEITPGIRVPITVTSKKLVTSSETAGVATLTTETPHGLVLGQKIEIANVDFMLDGRHKVAEIPSPTTFTYILNNPVNKFDNLIPILLSDISPTALSIQKTAVQYRQIVTAIVENITHLQRTAGVVTLQLNSRHRFAIGDKAEVVIENKKPAIQVENNKNVNSFDYSKYSNVVTITDITADTVTFTDPNPNHSNAKYNREFQSVETPSKNTIKLLNARPFLKIFPVGSGHGYGIGEQIQVSRVDGFNTSWTNPIFDGYSEIYEVSAGTSYTINNYKIIIDPDIQDNPIYQSDTLVYLYLGTTDPKFKAGDRLSVRELNLDATSDDISFLNGIHVIQEDSIKGPAGVGNQYYVYFRLKATPVAYKGSGSGGVASVDGESWIAYEPAYSEIKYDPTLKEPDSESSISQIEYVPAKGASSNKVTVTTIDRHNIIAGDIVSVKYAKDEDQKLYGADLVNVISVPNIDSFTYSVPKSTKSTDKDPIPPKVATKGAAPKTGKVVRLKSTVGPPQPVQVEFTNAYSTSSGEGGIVKLYSADHGLSKGDIVIVDVDGTKDYLIENDKEPVTITDITQDTFSYKTNTDIPATDKVEVRGIGFTKNGTQEVITFDIAEAVTRTTRTNAITKIKPKWHKGAANDNYVTYTTSTTTTAAVGDKVTISGLVNAGSTSTSVTTITSGISSLIYYYNDKNLVITCSTPHGLPVDSGLADKYPAELSNGITFSGMSSKQLIKSFDKKLYTMNFSNFNGMTVFVKKVIDADTLVIALSGPSFGFNSSGAVSGSAVVSNRNSVSTTFRNFEQFNVSGTVDYVSGSTFSVKYDFLSGKAGNGVSPSSTGGPEYTTTGTATFSSRNLTNFAASSIISISGIADAKSKTSDKDASKYSELNGTYRIIKVETNPDYTSPTKVSRKLFVANPLKKDDGKTVLRLPNYPPTGFDATFTGTKYPGLKNAKLEKYSKLTGTAYVDLGRIASDVYPITRVVRTTANRDVAVFTSEGHGFEVGDYAEVNVVGKSSAAFNQGGLPRQVINVTENTFTTQLTTPTKISHYAINDSVVTLYFSGKSPHNFVVGDTITVSDLTTLINGSRVITSTSLYTISFRITTATTIGTQTPSGTTNITIATGSAHRISVGEKVNITGVTPAAYNGTWTAQTGTTGSTLVVNIGSNPGAITVAGSIDYDADKTQNNGTVSFITAFDFSSGYRGAAVPGAFVKRVPTVFSRTFGEFPANAAIGDFKYSTNEYSGKDVTNTPITGSSLNTVASILDKYSNGISGFEYRVDCNLKVDSTTGNKKFTKTFVLIPIYPTTMTEYLSTLPGGKLAVGQWAPPAAFGADKVIFEYPGNITNVNMTESAQDSATRIFVSSSGSSAGATEIPYAAASDTTLLAAGWPLLDKKETAAYPQPNDPTNKGTDSYGNYDVETDLNVSANKFLYESKPPQGDITIGVNGSLTPVVGSYNPGDWCSIIVNDDFVKNRLNSPLEPRSDVIVRRIDSIKVNVPNNPAFPEMIDLKLIPDWQVDTIGK